jgi:transposase
LHNSFNYKHLMQKDLLMAIIHQQTLFSWKDCDDLGDLERLKLVIETIPDQKLMQVLARTRGRGRNDHPVSAMWNSILAGIIYQHKSIESLRRELKRNAQLRELCGFEPLKGASAVPSKSAYNRFIANIIKNKHLIDEIFDDLVRQLQYYSRLQRNNFLPLPADWGNEENGIWRIREGS